MSCKRLLAHVGEYLPDLVFVELVRTYKDPREFEIEAYIQTRVIRL